MPAKGQKHRRIKADLSIMRLAAVAMDTRQKLRRADLDRVPSLRRAFQALKGVIEEMGWADKAQNQ